jgi:hypothetical protein
VHRFSRTLRFGSINTLRLLGAALILSMAACVASIPIKDQAPKLTYSVNEKVVVALVDVRRELTVDKKPPTYIGVVHGMFGIPSDMHIYPWVALRDERGFTLAQELEQRIADGLQNTGATVVRIPAGEHVDAATAMLAAQGVGANRLLLISLDAWNVDMNINWVGSFDFDWGYTVAICDGAGVEISRFKDSGQEDIKEKASDSARNMITVAYRDRIEKLLGRPEIRAALSESAKR